MANTLQKGESSLFIIIRDFPFGFLPTTSVNLLVIFRDSLPARQICKNIYPAALKLGVSHRTLSLWETDRVYRSASIGSSRDAFLAG